MSKNYTWTLAVPASMALFISMHFETIFPVCVTAVLVLFMFRIFTSDPGLLSIFALGTALFVSRFWPTNMAHNVDQVDDKKSKSKIKKKDLLVQDTKKKNLRKEKKKRKGKTMDDDIESLQKTDITKVYQTLIQFKELGMESRELYYEFLCYILNRHELARNKYPLPDHLGLDCRWQKPHKGPIRRVCNRCNEVFYVNDTNLLYVEVKPCHYHPGKLNGIIYNCCNGDLASRGCTTYFCHVTTEPILDKAVFREIRDKKQVRADYDCAVYGLDCEMCITTVGLQVTKIGVVNVEGLTVYETYIQPDHPIVDYVTQYSGVTPNDLKGVTTTLQDVQEFLLKLLNKNTILVGHGLENDLKMLRIVHDKVVDTSVVFPRPDGRKRKLKDLITEFLHETIQDSNKGHDCIEDARACMALMLWKIGVDQKLRPPKCKDENANAFLQNQFFLPYYDPTKPIYILSH